MSNAIHYAWSAIGVFATAEAADGVFIFTTYRAARRALVLHTKEQATS